MPRRVQPQAPCSRMPLSADVSGGGLSVSKSIPQRALHSPLRYVFLCVFSGLRTAFRSPSGSGPRKSRRRNLIWWSAPARRLTKPVGGWAWERGSMTGIRRSLGQGLPFLRREHGLIAVLPGLLLTLPPKMVNRYIRPASPPRQEGDRSPPESAPGTPPRRSRRPRNKPPSS